MGEPSVTHRQFSESLTTLPMRDLTASGVFFSHRRSYDTSYLDVVGRTLCVQYRRDEELLVLSWKGADHVYHFPVEEVVTPRGVRRYFTCPESGQLSNSLFVLHDRILSKYQVRKIGRFRSGRNINDVAELFARLLGSEDRLPARGANRLRLVARLRALGVYNERHPALAHAARPIDKRLKSPSWAKTRPWLTVTADASLEKSFRRAFSCWERTASPLSTYDVLDLPLLTTDSVEALTAAQIKSLHREHGSNLEGELRWSSGRTVWFKCFATSNAEMVFLAPGGMPGQAVSLTQGGAGDRLYFVCPVMGDRTEKLYLREGRFGGRKAQRLIYASQRA